MGTNHLTKIFGLLGYKINETYNFLEFRGKIADYLQIANLSFQ